MCYKCVNGWFVVQTDEKQLVTQYQYNGWPTVEGEVPEVTRGLIELVDQTQVIKVNSLKVKEL